jgi:hypothetical protein
MITPAYSLTATERVLPRMALDFTTGVLDSRVTITRTGNTATVTNSSGVIVGINANLPRFDYDPTTLVCKGILIEEARTNLLLNSLIDGVSLVTQLVTTTAVAHTLSFYGTGTIVLSGTSVATVVGTGAYPSRQTLTFTPTAGVLTLTVTGTVQFAQLEVGLFATSFIPTAATAVTRNSDSVSMTGTNFSDWYNTTQGSLLVDAISNYGSASNWGVLTSLSSGSASYTNSLIIRRTSNTTLNTFLDSSGTGILLGGSVAAPAGAIKAAVSLSAGSYAQSVNGAVAATSATPATMISSINRLDIGYYDAINNYRVNGHIKKISYYSIRLTNAELRAFTK